MIIQRKKGYWNVILIVLLSLIMIIPFIIIGQLGVHSDWSFHSARVEQIFQNVKRGTLVTYIGSNTFSRIGNANFIFYPTFFLYPWVFLKFILSPINAYLIYVWLLFLATGLIAYFSMQEFDDHNSERSFYFALIYMVVPYHLYLTLTNYVIGEAQAYMFIPVVMLGMYKLLYKNKYITLAIGVSLMALCHYVSCFISVELCILIFLIYWIQERYIKLTVIKNMVKAVGLFFALTFWQFIPLLTDYFHQGLSRPKSGFMLVQAAGDYVVSAFNNDAVHLGGIGLLLMLTLLLGWHFVEKNSKYCWIYLLGIIVTLMITSAFPWSYFSKTPLSIIQFPYRYTSFAGFFLAIVLAKILQETSFSTISLFWKKGLIVLVILTLYSGSVYPDLLRNLGRNNPVLSHSLKGQYRTLRPGSDTPIIINNHNYGYQFSYGALFGETDYMPQSAYNDQKSILNRKSYVNGKEAKLKQTGLPNKIRYYGDFKKNTTVNLPALAYHHTTVSIDNKVTSYHISKRGTVEVKLSKSARLIDVGYRPAKVLFVAEFISAICWIVLTVKWFLKRKRENRFGTTTNE